jgi:hypothetical protein
LNRIAEQKRKSFVVMAVILKLEQIADAVMCSLCQSRDYAKRPMTWTDQLFDVVAAVLPDRSYF